MLNIPTRSDQLESHEVRPEDEFANLVTHGIGFIITVPATISLMNLVIHDERKNLVIACAVYSFTLVALYGASTLSHLFYDLSWRRFFRTLDQVCIFLLIAGSFTPFSVMFLNHGWWLLLSVSMWGLAILGIIQVIRVKHLGPVSKTIYLILGWLPVITLKVLYDSMPLSILIWILAGGLFYSVGTLFLKMGDKYKYFHALWHAFVIAGSTCHYIAILLLVILK